jgi:ABC-type multidrug transport system fused ATPase/permease subunit
VTAQQYHNFDCNKKVRFTKSGLDNWFGNTLAMLCFLINMPAIAYSMFISDSSASTLGLLMNYALFLIYQIAGLIQWEAFFETELITMERLYKFMAIEPEERYANYCDNWSPE